MPAPLQVHNKTENQLETCGLLELEAFEVKIEPVSDSVTQIFSRYRFWMLCRCNLSFRGREVKTEARIFEASRSQPP